MFKNLFGRKNRKNSTPAPICEQPELLKIVGHPELDFLFIEPSAESIMNGLDGWKWLNLGGLRPIAVSAFGDVFFVDQNSEILQLDWIEGNIVHVATNLKTFEDLLQTEEARDQLLLGGFVIGARDRGMILDEYECYDFKIMPILGGKMIAENVEKQSFLVKLHLAGQLHEQVKDLPPGTPINNIKFED